MFYWKFYCKINYFCFNLQSYDSSNFINHLTFTDMKKFNSLKSLVIAGSAIIGTTFGANAEIVEVITDDSE